MFLVNLICVGVYFEILYGFQFSYVLHAMALKPIISLGDITGYMKTYTQNRVRYFYSACIINVCSVRHFVGLISITRIVFLKNVIRMPTYDDLEVHYVDLNF